MVWRYYRFCTFFEVLATKSTFLSLNLQILSNSMALIALLNKLSLVKNFDIWPSNCPKMARMHIYVFSNNSANFGPIVELALFLPILIFGQLLGGGGMGVATTPPVGLRPQFQPKSWSTGLNFWIFCYFKSVFSKFQFRYRYLNRYLGCKKS